MVEVVLYRTESGEVPMLTWLESLGRKPRAKCIAALVRLEELGHELRRPEADYLRDGIHELRVRWRRVNHRMLYFFHARQAAIVSHGCTKERAIPPREIDRAVRHKERFEHDPETHSFRPEAL